MESDQESIDVVALIIASQTRFTSGHIVITPGALNAVNSTELSLALTRHLQGDWGDLDCEDKRANDRALQSGGRLLSSYRTVAGTKFWIITEADRSSTTILLPSEY
jgi:hypothetical protein